MDPRAKRTLRYFEKLVKQDDWHPHKTKYMRVYPAAKAYYMSRDRLINRAIKADAYYDLGDTVLINTRVLDEYLLKTGELILYKDDPCEEPEFLKESEDDDLNLDNDEIVGDDLEEIDDSTFDSEELSEGVERR